VGQYIETLKFVLHQQNGNGFAHPFAYDPESHPGWIEQNPRLKFVSIQTLDYMLELHHDTPEISPGTEYLVAVFFHEFEGFPEAHISILGRESRVGKLDDFPHAKFSDEVF
jgi:hypothetical protein